MIFKILKRVSFNRRSFNKVNLLKSYLCSFWNVDTLKSTESFDGDGCEGAPLRIVYLCGVSWEGVRY